MQRTHYKKGFSLVEVLVAISILLTAAAAPMMITVKSFQGARYAQEQATALFFAQEGVEAVIAARNSGTITAVASGNLSESWDWHTDGNMPDCFENSGCNMDFENDNPAGSVVSCSTRSDCALHYSAGADVPYRISSSGADPTPYTRVIYLRDVGVADQEVEITSTVYWNSAAFGGTEKSVELYSSVFNLYD